MKSRLCCIAVVMLIASIGLCEPPIPLDYKVYTKESIVNIGGEKHRVVEFRNEVFYLKLIDTQRAPEDLKVLCGTKKKLNLPNRVLVSTKVTRRSSLFISGLRQVCEPDYMGRNRIRPDPNVLIGFQLEDEPGDLFTNKMIFVSPFTSGLGFFGNW